MQKFPIFFDEKSAVDLKKWQTSMFANITTTVLPDYRFAPKIKNGRQLLKFVP